MGTTVYITDPTESHRYAFAGHLARAVLDMGRFAYKFFPDALDVWPGMWHHLWEQNLPNQSGLITPDFAENWLLEVEEMEVITILRHSWYPPYWVNLFINNYFVWCHESTMRYPYLRVIKMSYEDLLNLQGKMIEPPEEATTYIQKTLDMARLLCETSISHQLPIHSYWMQSSKAAVPQALQLSNNKVDSEQLLHQFH